MPVQQVSFDILKMLEDIENMFRLPASDRNNVLDFLIDRHVPRYVSADEGKIRQILINLVGNSVKFTENGTIKVSALMVIMQGNPANHDNTDNAGMLQLRVTDTGQGMSRDELESVFRPFFQTRSGQKHSGGTGLGLSISSQFAVLMGGKLSAESTGHGLGSEFLLEIPVGVCGYSDGETVRLDAPDVVSMLPPREKHRILIVEDVEENRSLLTELLAMWGLESRCAVNGREAVDMWHEWKPHLIFMDMRMPVMDGYAAIETIRSDTEEEQPVIVALTASTFEEQKLLILEKGADSFLSKPFLECDIARQLEIHLGLRFIYSECYDIEAGYEHEAVCPDFSVMDTDWLAKLSNAVSDADPGLINRLAEEIRGDYPDAASFIQTCADNFDYEPIRINIEKCQKHNGDS
jgi:Amt family ammonium transporter